MSRRKCFSLKLINSIVFKHFNRALNGEASVHVTHKTLPPLFTCAKSILKFFFLI